MSSYNPENPVIVQGDRSILLEVHNPKYVEARDALQRFAELEKSPEHIHTYRISPLSLWNAAALGLSADEINQVLSRLSKFEVPAHILRFIRDNIERYGRLKLYKVDGDYLALGSADSMLIEEIWNNPKLHRQFVRRTPDDRLIVKSIQRGYIKLLLIKYGFPVEDLAGYIEGDHFPLQTVGTARSGLPFHLRDYQKEAADVFYARGSERGGSGVIVLPCGAGKTIVGIATMTTIQTCTLILTTNITAVHQWRRELLDKTDVKEEDIGEYDGEKKEIKPITIATYQILTYRRSKDEEFIHFEIFNQKDWGLIIYDEVHLLPAPVFRVTSEIQARRRLGLTATLVREDGHEEDVFTLIGPKRYDVPWKELEAKGWIATAICTEVRVELPHELRATYVLAEQREKFRIAAENTRKDETLQKILNRHGEDRVLIIGMYLNQLAKLSKHLKIPIITGKTPQDERERLYQAFREGSLKRLIVSKVGNFAVDLPDANVLVQVSGTFGSRQEEAQRLGRILRPKTNGLYAHFYTLVTEESREQDFSMNRQLFLTEQGYKYEILRGDELFSLPM